MQKNITQFKSIINDIETTFHFESNCSTDIAKAAILECLKWIGQVEDYNKAQIAQQKEQEKLKETTSVPTDPKSAE